jgi:hypothetical protein
MIEKICCKLFYRVSILLKLLNRILMNFLENISPMRQAISRNSLILLSCEIQDFNYGFFIDRKSEWIIMRHSR